MNVRVKRVYEPVEPGDGFWVLVDRLWPRGLSKEVADVDLRVKDSEHNHAVLLKTFLERL